MPVIDFIYFDAGGGHRAAATALKAAIEQQKRPWTVRLVNLQEVLDPLDIFRKLTTIRLEDIYNLCLKNGWTLGSAQMLKVMQAIVRLHHGPTVRLLTKHWQATKPDMVVSLVPNFNRAMFEGLRAASSEIPYVTIITDFADFPPHFWIERQAQHLVCGTDLAMQQAAATGYPAARVFRASGMILRPNFYEPVEVDREAELRKLGLDPKRPTALVLFGGQGSHVMVQIAERLAKVDVQLIMICGRNQGLADRLRALKPAPPMHVVGFTSEIPYYMKLADLLIGKPGPGSISEAMAMQLPVIIERNAWTLAQERYNAEWVRERGVGVVLNNFREIAAAVGEFLQPGVLARHRAAVATIKNRAVWEIPDFLATLLK